MQIAKMNDAIRRKEKEEKLGKDAQCDASLDEDDGDCNDDDRCFKFLSDDHTDSRRDCGSQ